MTIRMLFKGQKPVYFKPLAQCLNEGSDTTKILMVSKATLRHEGAITPLVKMLISGKLKVTITALKALQILSSLSKSLEYMISADAIPPLLQLSFSVASVLVNLKEPAVVVLANLAVANGASVQRGNLSDGILESDGIICQLLSLRNLAGPVIQGHLHRALNGMACLPTASRIGCKMREGWI